jgi:hypothetical protein
LRVELVKEYVHKHFPSHSLLDYALAVEKVTTSKKDTVSIYYPCYVFDLIIAQLILNVDGCIAVCFVDLLRDSGAFTPEEADEYIKVSVLPTLQASRLTEQTNTDRYTERPVRFGTQHRFHRAPPRPETFARSTVPSPC